MIVACIIHNLLRDERVNYSTENYGNILLANTMPFNAIGRNSSHEAFRIRESFKNYFNNRAGSVGWQEKEVTTTN